MRGKIAALLLVLSILLVVWAARSQFQMVRAQSDVEITVSEDTYIESDRGDVNGKESVLDVRFRSSAPKNFVSYSLLKFNLSTVPKEAHIISMTLVVVVSRALSPLTVGTYLLLNVTWNESTLVWARAGFTEQTPAAPSDLKLVSMGGRPFEFNLTDFASTVGGGSAFTVVMKPTDMSASGPTGVVQFYSKDQADPTRAPKIIVKYELSTATITLTSGTNVVTSPGGEVDLVGQIALPAVAFAIIAGLAAFIFMKRRTSISKGPGISTPQPSLQVVPPAKAGLTSTGSSGLDRALNGGLPPKTAALIVTEFQDDADDILSGFLAKGCTQRGFGLYVTSRERAAVSSLLERFPHLAVLVCHPAADSLYAGRPRIVRTEFNPNQINIGRVEVEKAFIRDKSAQKFAAIDLISPLLIENDAKTVRFWLSEFLQKLRAMNFTTIAAINPRMHKPEDLAIVADVFDGEIELVRGVHDSSKYVIVKRFADHDYQKGPVKF